jgi:hypothetical protein
MLPFSEELKDGFHIRTFSSDLNETELKWHWDEEDRIVVCENETDWLIQLDNELPQKILKNKPIYIKEGVYHRLIKGSSDVIFKIKKIRNKVEN